MGFWDSIEMAPPSPAATNPLEHAIHYPMTSPAPIIQVKPSVSPTTVGALPIGADARDGASGFLPLTEAGNAQRLLRSHGRHIRFVPELGVWIVWNGTAWKWDRDSSTVRRLAAELAKVIYAEGAADMENANHFLSFARKSQTATVIKNTVSLISDMSAIRQPLTGIDADPMLAGFDMARQVVDLTSGIGRPATTDDFITKSLGISHIGDAAKATRWVQFLAEVFKGDQELIDWLKR